MKRIQFFYLLLLAGSCFFTSLNAQNPPNSNPDADYPPTYISGDTVIINMAALDQPFMYNRMGAAQPTGMIFALERDIVAKSGSTKSPGNVKLRDDKRPRPIVLRANQGDIIVINFTNYLRRYIKDEKVQFYEGFPTEQKTVNSIYPATRQAGVHIMGMEMIGSIASDGSYIGSNASSLVNPGGKTTYTLFAPAEGSFILYSSADDLGDGTIRAGQISDGLFGSLTVQPPKAEWYRSQVTELDLYLATKHWVIPGNGVTSTDSIIKKPSSLPSPTNRLDQKGFPVINYAANKFDRVNKDSIPILQMYKQISSHTRELVHTDLTAIITGEGGGYFPLSENSPSFHNVPASPDRRQPYREFAIHYHEAPYAVQAFPEFYDNINDTLLNITQTIQGGVDQFAINYGTGGIGAEIFANRVEIGPMADCIDCAYEEFFLSSWPCGDPAQVVNVPTNAVHIQRSEEDSVQEHINATLQYLMLKEASLLGGIAEVASEEQKDQDSLLRASKVLYPDDPSNVYHSYMNDHVKFRINHGGAGITHVHHQHAHQWLHSPNSDKGHYLDSQTINPGASYTLEMVHSGSGNLNKTVGDQIFHCHFYPHFAQGMWSLWRVHDVIETGTVLNRQGIPLRGSRALPDGEIKAGAPIPGLVPMPELPMAPIPGKVHISNGQVVMESGDINPGFPFYIPGVAGQRVPHPPLDFAIGDVETVDGQKLTNVPLSGGLPRNVVINGARPFENHTKYDWTKVTDSLQIIEIPEDGTYYEKVAMLAHATRVHNTVTPEGKKGNFLLNGLPPQPGAPYADPAVNAEGIPVGTLRRYKAAVIQVDAVLNKLGWHYPQQRPIVLWGDVASTVAGEKPPQPFFMRANSGEYIEYWHTNLVPEYYELDDFQVRTPTDVIGQHIHLVKFDVTSSDGAANGWNYEDGTLAPNLVTDHINEINRGKHYKPNLDKPFKVLSLEAHTRNIVKTPLVAYKPNPIWGEAPADQCWNGAQTTIQRWYSDPLFDNEGKDRTLRTVFTHDHFSPSTHQQIGLYAGLLIEPNGSKWFNSSTGTPLGFAQLGTTRNVPVSFNVDSNGVPTPASQQPVSDGGPTDWHAIIETANAEDSYREFMFEFQDNQQAYLPGSKAQSDPYPEYFYGESRKIVFGDPTCNGSEITLRRPTTFRDYVNNNYRGWLDPNHAVVPPPAQQGQFTTPELVSTGNRGTYSLNFRNEPLPIRVFDSTLVNPNFIQPSDWSTDLAFAFSSKVKWDISALNSQPTPGYIAKGTNKFIWPVEPLSPEMQPGDPYTPLVRAYEGDKVQFRTLVGAHVNPHFFNIHGIKWYFEPSFENSGFRSTQMMSLSEHFEMNFFLPNTEGNDEGITDYLYVANADETGMQNGIWGLMRAYDDVQPQLAEMPNNKIETDTSTMETQNCGCPADAKVRRYDVTAISVDKLDILGPTWGKLIYNETYRNFDSKAIVFLLTDQLNEFMHSTGFEPEPLVLRAAAGECIQVTLRNEITTDFVANSNAVDFTAAQSDAFPYTTSYTVGLNAELLSYDVSKYDGTNVGLNDPGVQTLAQGDGTVEYQWYAGQWNQKRDGTYKPEPVEFGSCVLSAPDPLEQYKAGLFGAVIVEPEGSYWVENKNEFTSYTSANVYASETAYKNKEAPLFREFVLIFQDNLDIDAEPIGTETGADASAGLNYKSEPLGSRIFSSLQDVENINFNQVDISAILSNYSVLEAPDTPTFVAKAGTPVRFRVLHTGGQGDGNVFNLHGHVWQEEPYTNNSTKLGYNPLSQWLGSRGQLGALNSFDLLINKAGGEYAVPGDYLYRDYRNQPFQNGVWGLFTVTDGKDAPIITKIENSIVFGDASVDPNTGQYPSTVKLTGAGSASLGSASVNQATGEWSIGNVGIPPATGVTVSTTLKDGNPGGSRTYTQEEVAVLSGAPMPRVLMLPIARPDVKQVQPGSNSGDSQK